MPKRSRDYKREYARRVERGLAKGLSRAAARGHPKEPSRSRAVAPALDPKGKLELALKDIRSGKALKATAKEYRIAPERLRRYLDEQVSATRAGRKWVIVDQRPKRFPVYSAGRLEQPVLRFPDLSKAGSYMGTVQKFLDTGNLDLLQPFDRDGVTDVTGRFFPFELQPNALYRLDAAGELYFPEIYKIVT